MNFKCKADGYVFDPNKHDKCPNCGAAWQDDCIGGGTMALWGDKRHAAAVPKPAAIRICLQEYGGQGQKCELNKEVFRIGRTADSDLVINDLKISRKHAEIISKSTGCYLVDVGSTNFTYHNGKKLLPNQMYFLNPNDVICFYKMQYVFLVEANR